MGGAMRGCERGRGQGGCGRCRRGRGVSPRPKPKLHAAHHDDVSNLRVRRHSNPEWQRVREHANHLEVAPETSKRPPGCAHFCAGEQSGRADETLDYCGGTRRDVCTAYRKKSVKDHRRSGPCEMTHEYSQRLPREGSEVTSKAEAVT